MTDEEIIETAMDSYDKDEISFDLNPEISRGEGGAWVAAWVWVDNEDEDEN